MKNDRFIASGIIRIHRGKNIFHLNFINMSYRNRGYDPRTHNRITVIIINNTQYWGLVNDWKNNITVIIDRIIILIYSAKKINANHPPIYSTLNPETSSDSPSAKSNGLRFVSARHVIIHIIRSSKFPVEKIIIFWDKEIS